MIPKQVLYILKFFSAIGFQAYQSKLWFFDYSNYINALHLTLASIFLGISIKLLYQYIFLLELLIIGNLTIQYTSAFIAYLWIIIDLYKQRHLLKTFWILYTEIDEFYCDQSAFRILLYTFLLIDYVLFGFIVIIYHIYLNPFRYWDLCLLNFLYIILFMFCEAKIFHYLFHLKILFNQLKAIESQLMECSQNYSHHKLQQIKQFLRIVIEMVDQLNGTFGCSLFFAILYNFLCFLTNINWMINYNDELLDIFGSIISHTWNCHIVLLLIYLFHGAIQCSSQVKFMFLKHI